MFTDKDDIERELILAMNVRPAAEFQQRVLMAAASASSRRPRLVPWLAAAAMLLFALGAWRVLGRPAPHPGEQVLARLQETGGGAPPPASPWAMRPGPIRRPQPARPAGQGRLPNPEPGVSLGPPKPEVIVPANQLALIHRFARELEAGRVQFAEAAEPEVALRRLLVPEMIIDPIAIVTLEPSALSASKGLQ